MYNFQQLTKYNFKQIKMFIFLHHWFWVAFEKTVNIAIWAFRLWSDTLNEKSNQIEAFIRGAAGSPR